jgi:hypothetical protein
MYMSSDNQIKAPLKVPRAKQIARINAIIESGGHRPQQTSLIEREYEETDTM